MARIWRTALVVIVVLFIWFVVCGLLFPMQLGPSKTGDAITGCHTVSIACEAYRLSEANPKHEWPRDLGELVHPFGGKNSFLPDGESNLIDPWGNRYMLSFDTDAKGQEYQIIWTANPKGELITQHGVGPKARPHN